MTWQILYQVDMRVRVKLGYTPPKHGLHVHEIHEQFIIPGEFCSKVLCWILGHVSYICIIIGAIMQYY